MKPKKVVKINIAKVINSNNAILHSQGIVIFNKVLDEIAKDVVIELDFSGLHNITTGFFFSSIGNLITVLSDYYHEIISIKWLENPHWKANYENTIELHSSPTNVKAYNDALEALFDGED